MIRRALLTCALLALPTAAHAQAQIFGPLSNCSGTVGTTAANIVFPSSGAGSTEPQSYVLLQNNSTSAQVIWVNALPTPTATAASPSIQLSPTASILFTAQNAPIPPAVSVIGSASGAAYTCWYK